MHDHEEMIPTRFPRGCSPHGPFPRLVRSGRAPIASNVPHVVRRVGADAARQESTGLSELISPWESPYEPSEENPVGPDSGHRRQKALCTEVSRLRCSESTPISSWPATQQVARRTGLRCDGPCQSLHAVASTPAASVLLFGCFGSPLNCMTILGRTKPPGLI